MGIFSQLIEETVRTVEMFKRICLPATSQDSKLTIMFNFLLNPDL